MLGQVSLAQRSYASTARTHAHDNHHQLVLPLRGTLELEIDCRGGRAGSHQAAFIPAGSRHAFQAADTGQNLFLVLDVELDPNAAMEVRTSELMERLARRVFVPITPPVRHLLACAEHLFPRPLAGDTDRCVAEPGTLASWTTLLFAALAPDRSSRPPDRLDLALSRAIAFMADNLERPITVPDIARAAGLSKSRLHALFRERVGRTPREQLAELRLRGALDLLGNPRLSIAEVAVRTGHCDQSALTRRVRAGCGLTPAAVRRSIAGAAAGVGSSST